ncbi:MAG: CDP-diacylglycerol---glycerol-3-phosphate 3-phosphatidyltransferase [Methanobacterium sp.]|jgi:phosphatidylglycerophosphate synthase|uniref:CDP-alcohol phosphatidyltransferase family protein n=1 Tax=Methanobacterium sp. TaxID=2164 RepID=UPI0003C9AF53|nr:CDP-alcohol phosphatidyltransferase family protein [Methanobacterium sp.]MDI3549174.1 CDP-diacylglycerol---glycerol-3-phosphate 3-phosphatidyltransferase [Methanobacterium sp.]CDG64374.1 CDP-alcohol phosphatidyltransferase [Methanobacterium sp. MB1]
MKLKSHIPNYLSLSRIIIAPIFIYTFINGWYLFSLMIVIFSGVTDILDGYIARKMDVTSDVGAYFDGISDFIFILACFLVYTFNGWYDPLVLLLIIIMFGMFIGTSGLKKLVYDPVGKYLGAYLMVMIFLSILSPEMKVRQVLLILLLILSLASVISRFSVFIIKN